MLTYATSIQSAGTNASSTITIDRPCRIVGATLTISSPSTSIPGAAGALAFQPLSDNQINFPSGTDVILAKVSISSIQIGAPGFALSRTEQNLYVPLDLDVGVGKGIVASMTGLAGATFSVILHCQLPTDGGTRVPSSGGLKLQEATPSIPQPIALPPLPNLKNRAIKGSDALICCELARAEDRAAILNIINTLVDTIQSAPRGYVLALVKMPEQVPRWVVEPMTPGATPYDLPGAIYIVVALAGEVARIAQSEALWSIINIISTAIGVMFTYGKGDPCELCIRERMLGQDNWRFYLKRSRRARLNKNTEQAFIRSRS